MAFSIFTLFTNRKKRAKKPSIFSIRMPKEFWPQLICRYTINGITHYTYRNPATNFIYQHQFDDEQQLYIRTVYL
jgi:hypothetical protein